MDDATKEFANVIARHAKISCEVALAGVNATRGYIARAGVAATTGASNAQSELWLRGHLRALLKVGLDIDHAYAFARVHALYHLAQKDVELSLAYESALKGVAASMGAFKGRN